ncbi:hypothetical protein [Castellaniella sp.]|uniref:hypothetical protein n=1 Tax=Castellaniella sp. TaxID=1955812 RepID=UPI002AFDEBB5|nr:hypothetical protein [Castellaniella sp.]
MMPENSEQKNVDDSSTSSYFFEQRLNGVSRQLGLDRMKRNMRYMKEVPKRLASEAFREEILILLHNFDVSRLFLDRKAQSGI